MVVKYHSQAGEKLALDWLVGGIIFLMIGLILVKAKRRVYTFYDDMFDTLSPDKPARGLRAWHKIPYMIFMYAMLIGGVFLLLLSAYTAIFS